MPSVVFTSHAEENLAKLDKQIAQRILKKIRWLAENLESLTPELLSRLGLADVPAFILNVS